MNGWGPKKFGMSLETHGNKLLGGISRDFCPDTMLGANLSVRFFFFFRRGMM